MRVQVQVQVQVRVQVRGAGAGAGERFFCALCLRHPAAGVLRLAPG